MKTLDGVKPTNGQSWARFIEKCERQLKEAGWKPEAVHPNSSRWKDPEGQWHPGPFIAWTEMTKRKVNQQ